MQPPAQEPLGHREEVEGLDPPAFEPGLETAQLAPGEDDLFALIFFLAGSPGPDTASQPQQRVLAPSLTKHKTAPGTDHPRQFSNRPLVLHRVVQRCAGEDEVKGSVG